MSFFYHSSFPFLSFPSHQNPIFSYPPLLLPRTTRSIITSQGYKLFITMKPTQQFQADISLSGPQIHSHIKKKPFTQLIKGVEFTYSILSKKQKTFVLTNQRFLFLKGIQSIGYARSLSEKTQLPFRQQSDIPKAKLSYSLSAIEDCSTENEILKVQFSFDKSAYWEFVCPSKACAFDWRRKIELAIERLKEFNNSKYEKYDDYIRDKMKLSTPSSTHSIGSFGQNLIVSKTLAPVEQKDIKPVQQSIQQRTAEKPSNDFSRNESFDFLALTNPNDQKGLAKSKSELSVNNNEAVVVKVPDNTQHEIIDKNKEIDKNMSKKNNFFYEKLDNPVPFENKQFNQGQNRNIHNNNHFPFTEPFNIGSSPFKEKSNFESARSNDTSPTPITHHNESPLHNNMQNNVLPDQMTKLSSIFLEKTLSESPSQHFLNKSFSNISVNGKQEIRSDIMALRRQWIDEIVSREQQSELMIDFKRYSKKIVEILVNELHISNDKRIFPHEQWTNQYARYIVEDVFVQIYFFTEEQIEEKHKRYQRAVKEFKNYDYFLQVTQNQDILFPPLMSIFEYKGFVGMVKTIIGSEREPFKNKEFFSVLDRSQFEYQSRINSEIFLNEAKCKIVSYKKNNYLSKLVTDYEPIYFLEKLESFLPEEKNENIRANRLLRPELIQDKELEENVFGVNGKDISGFEIQGILQKKIVGFVQSLQKQEEYFTNSQQLTELIHSFGLNVRHLGAIYKKISQKWLKMQIKAELAARSLKTLFRFDLQNCILNQIERMNTKEKQSQRQIRRVISFLNAIFGNGEGTFRVWRGLNNYSSKHYGSAIWEESFTDINIGFFLQAIQYHLKIVLSEDIHRKSYFQSPKTFEERDFIRFQADITIYNLDFTEMYEEINEFLEEVSSENFHNLCSLMVKPTKSKKTFIQLLKGQPLYEKINEYLLNFISPQDNIDFYNKLESGHMPNRFVYESKLAEIKWHLKQNKIEGLPRLVKYVEDNVRKWLGQHHYLLVQLNRTLAEFYSENKGFYMKAVSMSTAALEMQLALFGGDSQPIWKDYFLLAKIHYGHENYQQAMSCFIKAKKLVNTQNLTSFQHYAELFICLSKCYKAMKMFKESYLNIRQLYNALKEEGNQFLLEYLLESVLMIKDLLQRNQQYESYYRFIQTDFSHILTFFSNNADLLKQTMKLIFLPYLKSIIFQKSKNRIRVLTALEEISKLTQSTFSCTTYLQQKIREKKFPYSYIQTLKDIDGITQEIYANDLIQKWISFHRMSNDTLLQKIAGNQINRGFQFLADLSAILGILGSEAFGELSIMEK